MESSDEKGIRLIKKYTNSLYLVSLFIIIAGGGLFSYFSGALLLISCINIEKFRNWARYTFIAVASVTITLHIMGFFFWKLMLEQSAKVASLIPLNQTVIFSVIVMLKVIAIAYFAYGIFLFKKADTKRLFLKNTKI